MPETAAIAAPEPQAIWPKETAGHRMTRKVPTVFKDQTIGEIQSLVAHFAKVFKTIDYVYVLDRAGKFIGVLSIKDVFRQAKDAVVGDVCKKNSLVTVHADSHQERAAYLALQHNIKAVPVLDRDHMFLGAISNDSILTILYKEMHEDMLRFVGVRHPRAVEENVLGLSLFESFKHRIPWLLIGLSGGMVSAKIIGLFESTLAENIILASFIPLVVYMSGAVAMQSQAYIIRDLALKKITTFALYLLRQIAVIIMMAGTCGLLMFLASYALHRDPLVSITLGLTLCVGIFSSAFTGLLIPFIFSRIKMDPADASGPITTIVQDLLSVVIYLGVATWLL